MEVFYVEVLFYKYYRYTEYIINAEIGDNSSDEWKQFIGYNYL